MGTDFWPPLYVSLLLHYCHTVVLFVVVSNNNVSPVYAKLSSKTTGTAKLELKGEINDGGNYDNGDTVVDFIITGSFVHLKLLKLLNNIK